MAKKRDNVKLLAKFTLAELQAEVIRRQNGHRKWGYIVMDVEEDDDDQRPRFGIVAVAYWKKYGHLDDGGLCGLVSLPDGFTEVQESQVVYDHGDSVYAREVLDGAGFVFLGEQ